MTEGYVGAGPLTREFESLMARRLTRDHARATTTGSAALHIALLASGVKPQDSVLVPVFACRAVLNVVLQTGALPVLVDVDPVDLCIRPDLVRAAMDDLPTGQRAPRVLILVHSFGNVADVAQFETLGLSIVEDAASSFGASLRGKPVGSSGTLSVLSFGSTKMMTTGQGGMVLSSGGTVSSLVDSLMDYDGASPTSTGSSPVAFNYGFSDLQAALGISQLEALDGFVARRRAIASRYAEALGRIPDVQLPSLAEGRSFYRFIAFAKGAAGIVSQLSSVGIDARTSVSHFLDSYLATGRQFPGAESIRGRIVSLPIYPSLSDVDVERVASAACNAITGVR